MEIDAERLIVLVKERPPIYNFTLKEHHNKDHVKRLFEEIATAIIGEVTRTAGKSLPHDVKSIDDVWRAKYLYASAFHPDTGEKNVIIGRMSAQMPMNTVITAGMLTFYRTNAGIFFWQWFNQSFNATVNYSNRSGAEPISLSQLGMSYCLATGGALVTAMSLNKQAKNAPPLIGRWVPFVAVVAANCINIPCMRQKELKEGVPILDANNNKLGSSRKAAREGIAAVVVSRVLMAIPTMIFIPILVDRLDKKGVFIKYPRSYIPIQAFLCAFLLTFATPMCCAMFSQIKPVTLSRLESDIQEAAKKLSPSPTIGYYNKGL